MPANEQFYDMKERIAELEKTVASITGYNQPLGNAILRINELESALREIAEHPGCKWGAEYDEWTRYEEGIICGHRCCAEIARKALEKK